MIPVNSFRKFSIPVLHIFTILFQTNNSSAQIYIYLFVRKVNQQAPYRHDLKYIEKKITTRQCTCHQVPDEFMIFKLTISKHNLSLQGATFLHATSFNYGAILIFFIGSNVASMLEIIFRCL